MEMKLYGDMVFGKKVSKYGLEKGYLDYNTLARVVGDCILNNDIYEAADIDGWELISGEDYYEDEETGEIYYLEIYQWYTISEQGYKILAAYTDEPVYYHHDLNVYVWAMFSTNTSANLMRHSTRFIEM